MGCGCKKKKPVVKPKNEVKPQTDDQGGGK